MNNSLKEEIRSLIEGELFDDNETLAKYSKDASLFVVRPSLVVFPKNSSDIQKIVALVAQKKKECLEKNIEEYKKLSVTVRAAGSCMSGGSLSESIILDVTKYMNSFSVDPSTKTALVEPGVFYRDFEVETLKHNLLLPCYTASKNLCALGGMIGNNAAGEKTLSYGKMENYIEELDIVLADGKEYKIRKISRTEMIKKSHEHNRLGHIYEKLSALIDQNRQTIEQAKPTVSKNSAGYYLWNVEEGNFFDLCRLIVGSQGTLGIVTKAKIRLVDTKPESSMLVIFMDKIDNLGKLVNLILSHKPESVESYDDSTLKLAIRFLPEMIKLMKANFFKLMISFIPEALLVLRGGVPRLILLVEFAGVDKGELLDKAEILEREVKKMGYKTRIAKDKKDSEKFWTIRRESFSLLRKHVRGKRTAPFIDDICVKPEHLPEFLPKLKTILDKSKLVYTIAGHAGNGNFHIIPLMDMKNRDNRALISVLSDEVYDLLREYNGSITAEHNDGLVRTPYLNKMYSSEILELFKETKKIFDLDNVFNPGKKVPYDNIGSVGYMVEHLDRG